MKEKSIVKKYRSVLITAILLSVCFPAGIVMTVLCAVNGLLGVMAIGIVMLVAGFFGSPCIWAIAFPIIKQQHDVYNHIIHAHGESLSVSELANNMGKLKAALLITVRTLIRNGYLQGYSLSKDNERLVNTGRQRQAAAGEMSVAICSGCGAKNSVKGGSGICAYCGMPVGGKL